MSVTIHHFELNKDSTNYGVSLSSSLPVSIYIKDYFKLHQRHGHIRMRANWRALCERCSGAQYSYMRAFASHTNEFSNGSTTVFTHIMRPYARIGPRYLQPFHTRYVYMTNVRILRNVCLSNNVWQIPMNVRSSAINTTSRKTFTFFTNNCTSASFSQVKIKWDCQTIILFSKQVACQLCF